MNNMKVKELIELYINDGFKDGLEIHTNDFIYCLTEESEVDFDKESVLLSSFLLIDREDGECHGLQYSDFVQLEDILEVAF